MKTKTVYIDSLQTNICFYIGQNAKENFEIIDHSLPTDIWFHANDSSSCHVIASLPNVQLDKKIKRSIVKMGALLCKQHTNKLNSNKQIEICYTYCKNIQKTDTLGCVSTQDTKIHVC